MKNILTSIMTFLFFAFVFYLLISFISADADINDWHIIARLVYVLLMGRVLYVLVTKFKY